ncbi:MAG TPA: NAD(P)H-dependent oxidoreductase subunit E, partial [Candidatus Ozemobacteraceae bacterium]|nr:NAD(P)H-dependent oxidoreductase subunit E [Candidatus Ozemobacteraceae bacterium]
MKQPVHPSHEALPLSSVSGPDSYGRVQAIIRSLSGDRIRLIEALFQIQEIFGYIPDPVVGMLAQGVQLPRAEILSIATAIPGLFLKPRGRYVIRVCTGISCAICGNAGFLDVLRRQLKVKDHEVTKDGKFSIC